MWQVVEVACKRPAAFGPLLLVPHMLLHVSISDSIRQAQAAETVI
jgi:hypothetical protein